MERWKTIDGTGGRYEVSTLGTVRSLPRYETDKNGRRVYHTGRTLKQHDNGRGYYRVYMTFDGVHRREYVHRLVALAFIENPRGLREVNHKDFNPANNAVENLEWVSGYQNYKYSENAGHFVRTEKWVANLRSTLRAKMGTPVVGTPINGGRSIVYEAVNDSIKDGFQPSCITACCRGRRKTHKGYRWKYERQRVS